MYAMFKIECLWLLVFLGFFASPTESATKTWKFSNDILNPTNWEGGKPAKDCKGVIFPETLGSVASVFELYTEEVVLPINGELEIRQGGYIQFSEKDLCLRIKKLKPYHWLSPESWQYGENVAIPDVEKVPCIYDDVVFPSDAAVAAFYPEVSIDVNSIQIGGINLSNEQWQTFLQTNYGDEQFMYPLDYETGINIEPSKCISRSGCICHNSDDILDWICDHKEKREKAPCVDPVRPAGHCNDICGGIVVLDVTRNFILHEFEKQMPIHEMVDFYASKVRRNGKIVVQVVFVEKKGYSELSAKAASTFYSTISKDMKGFGINSAILKISGIHLPQGSRLGTAFSIILGTLVAVLLISVSVYIIYIGPLEHYNLGSRVPFREISLRNLRPFLFAKFENKEEGQMSMAASMVSLEKAFDNPMYGAHRPSTSSAAVEVEVLTEAQLSTTEIAHENPAYSEMKCEAEEMEDVEDTEE